MKNQKGLIPVIITLVVLLGIVGVYFFGKPKPQIVVESPTPTPDPIQVNPETGWKKYIDPRHGFSFEYPQDWKIDLEASSDYQIRLVPESALDKRLLIWVRVGNSYFKNIHDLSSQLGVCRKYSECIKIYSKSKTALDGVEALRYTRSQLGEHKLITVTVLKNGYEYSFDLQPSDTQSQNVITFDQILSTFKFIK